MILITGATGNLGSSVVDQLLKVSSPNQFVVTSSSSKGVLELEEKGLEARIANFNDPHSLELAFKGIKKLLLISTMDPNRALQHKNVIDAASKQGVEHIVYTSLAIKDIETSAVKDLMISHFETENYIKQSGITYTILRNTMYADALTQILGENALHRNINLPGGKGSVPYVLRREMGEATANLLLEEGHYNKTYNIVGSQMYSYKDVANALQNLGKENILYNDVSEDDFVKNLKVIGLPDFAIYLHAGTIKDIKNTQYEIDSNITELLLGRKTADISLFIKELFN